jgi:uncharacterized protein YbjQ (UPF0145 family)
MTVVLVAVVFTLVLLAAGLVIGRYRERSHLRRLDAAEAALASIVLTDLSTVPPGTDVVAAHLFMGESVIASDYWKTFAAGVRNLFGGEVRSLNTLIGRARRQAGLRMVQQAAQLGASIVVNVRFETSIIGGGPAQITEI